jgi:cobalamin synthase
MMGQWRLFQAALRYVLHAPGAVFDSRGFVAPPSASRFIPVAGMVVGTLGAAVYWLSAQIWPASVAVVLSLTAIALATGRLATGAARGGSLYAVFFLLLKYNALMALSSARSPLLPAEHLTLGFIMIAGHAASRALVVSVMATDGAVALHGAMANRDLAIALTLGLAPAALLGIPGLIGLVVAIALRMAVGKWLSPPLVAGSVRSLDITQQLTEAGFYLGALAAWRYV